MLSLKAAPVSPLTSNPWASSLARTAGSACAAIAAISYCLTMGRRAQGYFGTMVLVGVAVGLPLAYGLARFSESMLYGVHAGDPAVYALGLVLIGVIALAACFIPARRATRVDPLVALRYQ